MTKRYQLLNNGLTIDFRSLAAIATHLGCSRQYLHRKFVKNPESIIYKKITYTIIDKANENNNN